MTTSADQTARVWKTTDFSEVQILQHEAKRWVWDAAFSADSQYIFTGNNIFLFFLFLLSYFVGLILTFSLI